MLRGITVHQTQGKTNLTEDNVDTMANISFRKFHGAGNDFILLDNRDAEIHLTNEQREDMCKRHLGIGADGVLEILLSCKADFKLVYYNADGCIASLCGNGSRCAIAYFTQSLTSELNKRKDVVFECNDILYTGGCRGDGVYFLALGSIPLSKIQKVEENNYYLDTGSPHHVAFVSDVSATKVIELGSELCYNKYAPGGSNVNFCTLPTADNKIKCRTFERGVDNETMACGTGATAVAVVAYFITKPYARENNGLYSYDIDMPGGTLTIQFASSKETIFKLKLIGPAVEVFQGTYSIYRE